MREETKELNKVHIRLAQDNGENTQDRITNNRNLLVSGMHEGTKVEYSINHSAEWRIANDPVNHLVNIELADGEYHSIRVRQAAEGKHSVYNEITNVVIDTQPPKIDYIRLEKPELSMVRTLPVFEGKTEPEADVVVNIHKEFYITKADEEGKFSLEITETLADGKYIPKVLVTDKAGNLSTDKAAEMWYQGEEVVVGNGNIAVVDAVLLTVTELVTVPSVNEGDNVEFNVTLLTGHKGGTIDAPVLGGTATETDDYSTAVFSNNVQVVGGKLVIPAGVDSFTISYPTVADELSEGQETLSMTLGGKEAETIINDTSMTTLSISVTDPVQREVDSTEGSVMTFTVTASKPVLEDTVVTVSLSGQATVPGEAGADYTAALADGTAISNGTVTLTIKKGETQASFTVDPINDNEALAAFGKETNESVIATLNNKTGFTMGEIEARGMIINGEPFAIPRLDADLNLMTGVTFPEGDQTTQVLEGPNVAMGSDYNDKIYIGYYINGNDAGQGDFANSLAKGQNFDSSLSFSTLDLGKGNDTLWIREGVNLLTRVYLGEGDDTFIAGGAVTIGTDNLRPHVFGEGGNDTITFKDDIMFINVYGGSGSDTITVQGSMLDNAMIDLGSGRAYTSAYETSYTNGLSLGNDDNVDLASDINTLHVHQNLGMFSSSAHVYGGNGQDHVTIDGGMYASSTISLGAGNDTVTVGRLADANVIDMGTGIDTVTLSGSGTSVRLSNSIKGAEVIDINGNGANTLYVNAANVRDSGAEQTIKILGGADDTVNLGYAASFSSLGESLIDSVQWGKTGATITEDGHTYSAWQYGNDTTTMIYIENTIGNII
ncbi:Ig-like domain-containing protein [Testudinibacter sp. P80/BLE/0925]|uniref:Ig-like domain-containing protein n=1 Tax=Testudinibacter sp. TW-1 TaxID=3417757 RepID=UPI003D3646CD